MSSRKMFMENLPDICQIELLVTRTEGSFATLGTLTARFKDGGCLTTDSEAQCSLLRFGF